MYMFRVWSKANYSSKKTKQKQNKTKQKKTPTQPKTNKQTNNTVI